MAAECTYCMQPMDGTSCTLTVATIVRSEYGEPGNYPRLPYGPDSGGRCHDCGTPRGGIHHPGCDMEQCPVPGCGNQAIGCDCVWKGDPLDVHPLVAHVAVELQMDSREQVALIARIVAEAYRYMGADIGSAAATLTAMDCDRIADEIEASVADAE